MTDRFSTVPTNPQNIDDILYRQARVEKLGEYTPLQDWFRPHVVMEVTVTLMNCIVKSATRECEDRQSRLLRALAHFERFRGIYEEDLLNAEKDLGASPAFWYVDKVHRLAEKLRLECVKRAKEFPGQERLFDKELRKMEILRDTAGNLIEAAKSKRSGRFELAVDSSSFNPVRLAMAKLVWVFRKLDEDSFALMNIWSDDFYGTSEDLARLLEPDSADDNYKWYRYKKGRYNKAVLSQIFEEVGLEACVTERVDEIFKTMRQDIIHAQDQRGDDGGGELLEGDTQGGPDQADVSEKMRLLENIAQEMMDLFRTGS